MGKLEISQSLIWAIIHKNPSNSSCAITAESRKINVWQTNNKCVMDKSNYFRKSVKIPSNNLILNVNIW